MHGHKADGPVGPNEEIHASGHRCPQLVNCNNRSDWRSDQSAEKNSDLALDRHLELMFNRRYLPNDIGISATGGLCEGWC
jgi:hypothetical protein